MVFTYSALVDLAGNQLGKHDVACPDCGPGRRSKTNQKRKVLRFWLSETFASYYCVRCGTSGYARDHDRSASPRPARVFKPAIDTLSDQEHAAEQLRKARFLWACSIPIGGTRAERYFREARGITCPLPETVRYLAPRKREHHHAVIAGFGIPEEPEPGRLLLREGQLQGVHLTLLRSDGCGKASVTPNKIMVGKSSGAPIVLAPMNDNLGLAITEGIEDGLSAYQATGLGTWAAGAAGRLPNLASAIPSHTDCVTIFADGDEAGEHGAHSLVEELSGRRIETIICMTARAAA
jgi:hypothetical protein